MKIKKTHLTCCFYFVLVTIALLICQKGFAGTNSVRIAIGQFIAPAGNLTLIKEAGDLPDLLTVCLSQKNEFELVEREKVNAVWNELHLAEMGLTSVETVGKLGHILSCNWLVSGSFVQSGTNTQIWVKVINTQDSVVMDLQCVPYNSTNFSTTAQAIADFLVQTHARSRPQEFIALGKFLDMSVSTTREDWSPRLVALIEKHFLSAGYGVVESVSVGMGGSPSSAPAKMNGDSFSLSEPNSKEDEVAGIVSRASTVAPIPTPLLISGLFQGVTAVKLWQRKVFLATGTTLEAFDTDSGNSVEFTLPFVLKKPVTVIEVDDLNVWLGTEDGLFCVSQDHKTFTKFGEKDGFPTTSITTLKLLDKRLFIGFGFQRTGAFGYLDCASGIFTGLMGELSLRKNWQESVKRPPTIPISAIATDDGHDIYVESGMGLQLLDFNSKKWSSVIPSKLADLGEGRENRIAINSRYLAVILPGYCIAVRKFPGTNWMCLNLSLDVNENCAASIAFDPDNLDFLWIGGSQGKVTLLNLAISKIVAEGKIPSPSMVEHIFTRSDKVIFVAGFGLSETIICIPSLNSIF